MSLLSRCTPNAIKAIKASGAEAKRLNNDFVGSEHLLLGILNQIASVAAVALSQLKVELESCRRMVEMTTSPSSDVISDQSDFPINEEAKIILENALVISNNSGEKFIATEHILLGILKHETCIAVQVLKKMTNQNVKSIREKIVKLIESESIEEQKPNQLAETGENKSTTPALDTFGRDITELVRQGKIDPIIGREEELTRMIHILARRRKNNPVLIGEAGVGKTSLVEGLAQLIVQGKVPDMLAGKRLVELDLSNLVAGTKYRGQFEERLRAVVYEVTVSTNIILYIDELHTMVGAGNSEGSTDAANILKPALARGELQCIGATTLNEYRKYIEKDAALERRFQSIIVIEPTQEQAVEILKGLKKHYEKFHNVQITDDAIKEAVALSARYIMGRQLPDKAIDVLDEAGVKAKLSGSSSISTAPLESFLDTVSQYKERAVAGVKYEIAAELRDKSEKIRSSIDKIKAGIEVLKDNILGVVDEEVVRSVVCSMTGIPLKTISNNEAQKLLDMEKDMHNRIISQNDAIVKVCDAVRRSRAGLKDEKRPVGSFLFLGPTGVGKSLLAKTLAEYLFGDESALIKIDMSEYSEKHNVSRLFGAPPGYIGYDDAGQLTEKIRRKPYAVILFDEIEKAHPDVHNSLLQILEDGQMTDGHGKVVNFRNTVIVMTSNVGSSSPNSSSSVGFGKRSEESEFEDSKRKLNEAIEDHFKPEFINRFDELVFFKQLNKTDIGSIADMEFAQIAKRAAKKNIKIVLTEEAKEVLINAGFDAKFGARPMRRAVEKLIESALSIQILSGKINSGDTVNVIKSKEEGKLDFSVIESVKIDENISVDAEIEEKPEKKRKTALLEKA